MRPHQRSPLRVFTSELAEVGVGDMGSTFQGAWGYQGWKLAVQVWTFSRPQSGWSVRLCFAPPSGNSWGPAHSVDPQTEALLCEDCPASGILTSSSSEPPPRLGLGLEAAACPGGSPGRMPG